MTTTYIGEETIGAMLPFPGLVAAQVELEAKLAAMVTLSAQLGLPALSIGAQLQIAAQITAGLQASLTIGITPPSISAQLGIVLAVIAQLRVQLALFDILATAGVFAYAIDAATNAVGGELSTALAAGFPGHGPTTHANVLVLGAVDPAVWTAMGVVFKTS